MYSGFNGLISSNGALGIIMTCTESGPVKVAADWRDDKPVPELDSWDDVVEISMNFPSPCTNSPTSTAQKSASGRRTAAGHDLRRSRPPPQLPAGAPAPRTRRLGPGRLLPGPAARQIRPQVLVAVSVVSRRMSGHRGGPGDDRMAPGPGASSAGCP
jgi:hypothetical protein